MHSSFAKTQEVLQFSNLIIEDTCLPDRICIVCILSFVGSTYVFFGGGHTYIKTVRLLANFDD